MGTVTTTVPGCCPCCVSVSVSLCPWYLARNVRWMSLWCPAVWTISHQSWRVSHSTSHMNTTALDTGSAVLSLPSGSACLSVLPSLILSYCTLTIHYHYKKGDVIGRLLWIVLCQQQLPLPPQQPLLLPLLPPSLLPPLLPLLQLPLLQQPLLQLPLLPLQQQQFPLRWLK